MIGRPGACAGSGRSPYQTIVDFAGPRLDGLPDKVPSKHALGLLFLLAADASVFPAADPPGWVTEWLASREQRAERVEARAATKDAEPDPAARAKHIQARERKVDAGLSDLERWLRDLVRRGLAAAKTEGYAFWDQAGARLVDAQARGAAGLVRRLAGAAVSGDPERLVTELGLLRLLAAGYARLDELPAPLAATVAGRVGIPVSRDEVLATAPVADAWAVFVAPTANRRPAQQPARLAARLRHRPDGAGALVRRAGAEPRQ